MTITRERDEAGFAHVPVAGVTLLSLMLLIALSSIMMGRAAETWTSQIRREQEQDLIRYGQEYKRGIEDFFFVNRRYPTSLEELCAPAETLPLRRFVRRCYLDPITGEEFRLINQADVGRRRVEREQDELQEDEPDDESLYGGFARRDRGASARSSGPRVSDVDLGLPGQASKIDWSGDTPFVGVASSSDLRPFRKIDDAAAYDEWEFIAQVRVGARPAAGAGAGAGGSAGAGNPGTGQNPGSPGRRSGSLPGAPGTTGQPGSPGAGQSSGRPRLDQPQAQPQGQAGRPR